MKNFNTTNWLQLSLVPHVILFSLGYIFSLKSLGIFRPEAWMGYFYIVLIFKIYYIFLINSSRDKNQMNRDKRLIKLIRNINLIPLFLILLLSLNLFLLSKIIKETLFPLIIILEIAYYFYIAKIFLKFKKSIFKKMV